MSNVQLKYLKEGLMEYFVHEYLSDLDKQQINDYLDTAYELGRLDERIQNFINLKTVDLNGKEIKDEDNS